MHNFDYLLKTCFLKCFLREYYDVQLGLCMRCPPNCIICKDSKSCQTCDIGKKLIDGWCYGSCPDRMYEVKFDGRCAACLDKNCLRCPYDGRCRKCKKGFVLDAKDSVCVRSCKGSSKFFDKVKRVCYQCQSNCLRCDESGCRECKNGYDLKKSKNKSQAQTNHG